MLASRNASRGSCASESSRHHAAACSPLRMPRGRSTAALSLLQRMRRNSPVSMRATPAEEVGAAIPHAHDYMSTSCMAA